MSEAGLDSRPSSKEIGGSQAQRRGSVADRQGSKEGAVNKRRSSLCKGSGQSLVDLAAEKEATKGAFLKRTCNPILEAMALKYFESGDETVNISMSYEDIVKTLIDWVQSGQDMCPPEECTAPEPARGELERLKEQIAELTKKLEEIDKLEGASGAGKMQGMVRRMSNVRKFSKGNLKGSK